MRLIDADTVDKTIERFIGYLDEDMILRIKMKISKIPTVDRQNGEWKKVYLTPEEKCFYGELWECSVCRVKDKKSNFCPNCGTDMRKEGKIEAE